MSATAPQQTPFATTPQPTRRSGLAINGVLALALAVAIVLLLVGLGGGAAASGPLQPASTESQVLDAIEVYVVQPGDTLWDIAARITPEGGDHRAVIDALSEAAGGADLEIGQRIVIDHADLG